VIDAARFEALDGVEHELGSRRFRLLVQQRAELVAGYPVRKSGKVVDPLGVDDLAAGAQLLDHDDLEPAAAREHRRGQSRHSRADDDQVGVAHRHSRGSKAG
jgi:hypothetical protein